MCTIDRRFNGRLFSVLIALILSSCSLRVDEAKAARICEETVLRVEDDYNKSVAFTFSVQRGEEFDRYRGSPAQYRHQRAALMMGFGFQTVDEISQSVFVGHPHNDFSFREKDRIVFVRNDCSVQDLDERIILHYYNELDYDFKTAFHECFVYVFFRLSGIEVDPTSFEYLVVRHGDPIPRPGNWDIMLIDYDKAGVGVGFNTESARFRCLAKASPLNAGRE
ncbi:MAG: hypothetical protein AAFY10_01655 [Pseudomonadota bacterium]